MNKQEVAAFFDRMVPQWDADMILEPQVVAQILDNAQVLAGKK